MTAIYLRRARRPYFRRAPIAIALLIGIAIGLGLSAFIDSLYVAILPNPPFGDVTPAGECERLSPAGFSFARLEQAP